MSLFASIDLIFSKAPFHPNFLFGLTHKRQRLPYQFCHIFLIRRFLSHVCFVRFLFRYNCYLLFL